jgi:SAM-dependent methyltransferase
MLLRKLQACVDTELNWGRAAIAHLAAEAQPFSTAIDVGAGTGADLDSLRRLEPHAVLGAIEVYPPNQRRLESMGFVVHGINIERDPLPYGDASLDLVVTNQTLEHVKEVFWILHEITRVLKVDGHLLIGVPNLASLHNRLLLLGGIQPTVINNASAHVRGYTKGDVVRLLDSGHASGFKLVTYEGSNFYPFGPRLARALSSRCPTLSWGMFLLFRKRRDYTDGFLRYPITSWLETNFYLGPRQEELWSELRRQDRTD